MKVGRGIPLGDPKNVTNISKSPFLYIFKSALLLSERFWADLNMCIGIFFGPNHFKKTVFMFMRNYKEILS